MKLHHLTLMFTWTFAQPLVGGDLEPTETADLIRVTLRDKPILEYIKIAKPVPDGIEPFCRRSEVKQLVEGMTDSPMDYILYRRPEG